MLADIHNNWRDYTQPTQPGWTWEDELWYVLCFVVAPVFVFLFIVWCVRQ